MFAITPNLSAFAADNLLVKERVYIRLLTDEATPTPAKARAFFLQEFDRAMQDVQAVVAQETLA